MHALATIIELLCEVYVYYITQASSIDSTALTQAVRQISVPAHGGRFLVSVVVVGYAGDALCAFQFIPRQALKDHLLTVIKRPVVAYPIAVVRYPWVRTNKARWACGLARRLQPVARFDRICICQVNSRS